MSGFIYKLFSACFFLVSLSCKSSEHHKSIPNPSISQQTNQDIKSPYEFNFDSPTNLNFSTSYYQILQKRFMIQGQEIQTPVLTIPPPDISVPLNKKPDIFYYRICLKSHLATDCNNLSKVLPRDTNFLDGFLSSTEGESILFNAPISSPFDLYVWNCIRRDRYKLSSRQFIQISPLATPEFKIFCHSSFTDNNTPTVRSGAIDESLMSKLHEYMQLNQRLKFFIYSVMDMITDHLRTLSDTEITAQSKKFYDELYSDMSLRENYVKFMMENYRSMHQHHTKKISDIISKSASDPEVAKLSNLNQKFQKKFSEFESLVSEFSQTGITISLP